MSETFPAKLLSIFNPTGHSLAAEFWQNSHVKGFSPVCGNKFRKETCRISKGAPKPCDKCPNQDYQPLTEALLREHMSGKKRYGIYPLGQDGLTAWVAADLDNHHGTADPKADVYRIIEVARPLDIPVMVFNSNSGNGYHVYIFFKKPIPAWKGRMLLLTLIQRAEVSI